MEGQRMYPIPRGRRLTTGTVSGDLFILLAVDAISGKCEGVHVSDSQTILSDWKVSLQPLDVGYVRTPYQEPG